MCDFMTYYEYDHPNYQKPLQTGLVVITDAKLDTISSEWQSDDSLIENANLNWYLSIALSLGRHKG